MARRASCVMVCAALTVMAREGAPSTTLQHAARKHVNSQPSLATPAMTRHACSPSPCSADFPRTHSDEIPRRARSARCACSAVPQHAQCRSYSSVGGIERIGTKISRRCTQNTQMGQAYVMYGHSHCHRFEIREVSNAELQATLSHRSWQCSRQQKHYYCTMCGLESADGTAISACSSVIRLHLRKTFLTCGTRWLSAMTYYFTQAAGQSF